MDPNPPPSPPDPNHPQIGTLGQPNSSVALSLGIPMSSQSPLMETMPGPHSTAQVVPPSPPARSPPPLLMPSPTPPEMLTPQTLDSSGLTQPPSSIIMIGDVPVQTPPSQTPMTLVEATNHFRTAVHHHWNRMHQLNYPRSPRRPPPRLFQQQAREASVYHRRHMEMGQSSSQPPPTSPPHSSNNPILRGNQTGNYNPPLYGWRPVIRDPAGSFSARHQHHQSVPTQTAVNIMSGAVANGGGRISQGIRRDILDNNQLVSIDRRSFRILPFYNQPTIFHWIRRPNNVVSFRYFTTMVHLETGRELRHIVSFHPWENDPTQQVSLTPIANARGELIPPSQTQGRFPPILPNSMRVLVWNIRGGGRPELQQQLRDFIDRFRPEVTVVFDTRMAYEDAAEVLTGMFDLNTMILTPPASAPYAGGYWVLWDAMRVTLDMEGAADRLLNLRIIEPRQPLPISLAIGYNATSTSRQPQGDDSGMDSSFSGGQD